MPVPLVPIALGLAQFAPQISRWLGGEGAAEIAAKAVSVANAVTGVGDPKGAMRAIAGDPRLQLEYQRAMAPVIIAEQEAEARKLEAINETMRREAASGDAFVRRWRPFFGYVVALTWFVQMVAVGAAIVMTPAEAPAVISAMTNLSVIWGVALSVLGISVAKRSQDKVVAAGQAPGVGILAALAQRVAGAQLASSVAAGSPSTLRQAQGEG